jgi:hypothetical protein
MNIAIRSSSAAVTRALEAIINATGHAVTAPESATLVIEDAKHPLASIPTPADRMVLGGSGSDATACPIHPSAFARLFTGRDLRNPARLAIGTWELNTATRMLVAANEYAVALTEKETLLLGALARHFPQPATRETLLQEVWGITADIDTHTLETHIYRLRTKIAELGQPFPDIVTVDSAYRLAYHTVTP